MFTFKLIKPLLFIPLISLGCVYFNTFYNAETYFKEGMKTIEESAIEDSNDIPSKAKTQLEKAINKCNIVIDNFPDSKYIDDAYYIIGKSGFYRSEFTRALKSFNILINEFPESEFANESKIWSAYTQFKLGELDSSQSILIDLLEVKKQSKDNKYLIYTALGDISMEQDSILKAFDYLDFAVENATDSGKRISIYNKIINIAQKENAYERAVKYLLLLEKQSDSKTIRKNARLKWIEFNKKLKNYDIILQEIDIMLGTAEYESMYLDLKLERAQIYIDKGELIDGRSALLTFIEETGEKRDNKIKKARAKSYFILGESSLIDEFDFSSSREYFEKMADEYNRSENRVKADKYQDMMDDFDRLKESYRKALKAENEVLIDSNNIIIDTLIIDAPDSIQFESEITQIDSAEIKQKILEDMFNPEKNEHKRESKSTKDNYIIGTPDSLLMLIGEMLVYDFGRMDSAANRYENLINIFPDSKFASRAMYALTFYSADSLTWKNKFNELYPNPNFLIEEEEYIEVSPFDQSRQLILDNVRENPKATRDSLNTFFIKNNDPDALYISAYISDYLLNDIESSKLFYKMFVDSFPKHDQHKTAKNRFEVIEQSILDTFPKIEDTTTLNLDTLIIVTDSTKKMMMNFDSLFYKRDSLNKYEMLKGMDIQLDSNFRKSQFLRPIEKGNIRQ